jgi:transcriptional regulator with XRE-family HTH domain
MQDPEYVSDKPTLGQWLAEARMAAGLTQKQVEDLTGIDRNQLSAYENDREPMRVSTLERITEATGAELPWRKGRYLRFLPELVAVSSG